jgi:hypothetical protein
MDFNYAVSESLIELHSVADPGMFIPDPRSEFFPSRFPDPGSKRSPDPGSKKNFIAGVQGKFTSATPNFRMKNNVNFFQRQQPGFLCVLKIRTTYVSNE